MTADNQSSHFASFNLLSIALTAQSQTVSELAALIAKPVDEVRGQLEELEAGGFVELRGSKIVYLAPHLAIAHRADALLSETSTAIENYVSETKELLSAVPKLISSWNVNSSDTTGLYAQVFHGPFAPTDLWLEVSASRKIQATDGILPSAAHIFGAPPEMQQVWFEAIQDENFHVRTILSSQEVKMEGAVEVIVADMAVGAEFRMLPQPPSWLWIADDDLVGLPFAWGEAWPTSVFACSDPAIVSMTRWLYDRLWSEAVPVESTSHEWDSLLSLMSKGATVESASRSLGISPRTGRRRIVAASKHFGVEGQFALGAAWQRSFKTNEKLTNL